MKKIIIILILIINSAVLSKDRFEFLTPKNNITIPSNSNINLNWKNEVTLNTSLSYYDYSEKIWNDIATTNKTHLLLDIDDKYKDSVLFRIQSVNYDLFVFNLDLNYTYSSDIVSDYKDGLFVMGSVRDTNFGIIINNVKYDFENIEQIKIIDNNRILLGNINGVWIFFIKENYFKKLTALNLNIIIEKRCLSVGSNFIAVINKEGNLIFFDFNGNFIKIKQIRLDKFDENPYYQLKIKDSLILYSTYTGDIHIYKNVEHFPSYRHIYNMNKQVNPLWDFELFENDILVSGGTDDTLRFYNKDNLINFKVMNGDIRCITKISDSLFAVSSFNDSYIYFFNLNGDLIHKVNIDFDVISMTYDNGKIYGAIRYNNEIQAKYFIININEPYEDIIKVYIKEHKDVVFIPNDKILNNYRIVENYKDYQLYNMDGNEVYDIYNAGSGIYVMILNNKQLKWILKD